MQQTEQMTYRPGLPPLPQRMRALPLSDKGYPVPYFVAHVDGAYNFLVADARKQVICLQQNRCWICGQTLGVFKVFVVGPMAALNRISSEPPSHLECAEYAVAACPFLLYPKAKRRELEGSVQSVAPPGVLMEHNPGVMLLWTTKKHEPLFGSRQPGLIQLGDPTTATWYSAGHKASRQQAEAALAFAKGELAKHCDDDPRQLAMLDERVERLRKLLPHDGPP